MDVSGGYHPEWGNPVTKEVTWYALTDKWILAQKLRIAKIQFAKYMKLKEKEDQSGDTLVLLRMGNKIPIEEVTQSVKQRLKEWPSRDCPTWGFNPYTTTKTDTIVDANKSLLTGDWYSCLLRGSASARQIQKCMLTVIHWMEHRVPKEGVKVLKELKGFAAPEEEQQYELSRTPRSHWD